MQSNLPLGTKLYHKIKYYRENPHEVPENCRKLVIDEGRKRGEGSKRGEGPDSGYYQPTPQASGSGYPDYPTSYNDGSTSRFGADHYGQSIYQPSGSANASYTRDQPAVNNTSGTNVGQPSGYNQYPSQSGGSGYPQYATGGQQYDHRNERTDRTYGDANKGESSMNTVEPRYQERTPAPRNSTASDIRPSRKRKEPSRR